MDAVLTAVLGSAPQLGVGGVALTFIVLLLRREGATEERHAAELNRKDEMHAAELERIRKAHDDELGELRNDIKALRDQVDTLQTTVDLEREERRKAQDELAAFMRQRGGAT